MTAQAQEPIDALFDRNMDVFREHFPAVAARLEQISERICTRVPAPDDNISIDGTLLYPTNAAEWVRLQMEGVDQFGERILVPVAYSNLSAIGRPLLDDFLGFCRDHQYQIASQRIHEVGFHLVFGIGLGLHVPQLLEQTTARRLVLIEPVPEFLLLSMEVVDWAAIFQAAEERRVALQFILYEKPAEIARAIEHEVIFHGRPFLDGTYCYFHYYSWVLREAYSTFREGQRHIELNTGFYEDEMVMMSNAFGNFANNAFHQLAGKRYVEQKVPLFVCGSGPSLRATIPEIQKWRDHVVVMSCGTSLGPLLEAGIRPDLHCEIENVEMVYDILSGLEGKHGFQGITLVASSTVQPNVPPLFERTWFYQRGALTASTILAPDVPSVKGVDPLVSNAAFSVGATLGFRTVYLIGADCGARRKDDHHVKGAYKFESEEEKAKHDKMWADRFDREVPGNFGGKVYSAWHLDLSRRMFEEAQASVGVDLYNCSDGARIKGAKPKAPRTLRFDAKVDSHRVLANLASQMKSFDKGEFVKTIAFDQVLDTLEEYREWVFEVMKEARSGGSFYDLFFAVNKLPTDRAKAWFQPKSFIGSSIDSMIWVAAFFCDRIEDLDKRRAVFDYGMERLEERFTVLFSGARDFLTDLQARAHEASA